MDTKITVTLTAPDDATHTEQIGAITKASDTIGEIGLSIAESKKPNVETAAGNCVRAMRNILCGAVLLPALPTKTSRQGAGPDQISHCLW